MNINIEPFYCYIKKEHLFALQPNNRIFWRDSNFITKPLDPKSIPKYKVDKEIFICERSDRWTSENTDSFYYDIIEENDKL